MLKINKQIVIGSIELNGVWLTEIYDKAVESVEQDQTARTCSLILLYTLRKINPRSRTEGYE